MNTQSYIASGMVSPSQIGFQATTRTPVGYIQMFDSFAVACYRKPGWLHRVAMRLAFGWTWRAA